MRTPPSVVPIGTTAGRPSEGSHCSADENPETSILDLTDQIARLSRGMFRELAALLQHLMTATRIDSCDPALRSLNVPACPARAAQAPLAFAREGRSFPSQGPCAAV